MEASRLDRVQVDVAGTIVEISWDERDTLLANLRPAAGCATIVQRFEAVGASRPVELDDRERAQLCAVLEVWRDIGGLPAGIVRLLAVLVWTAPGGT